MNNEDLEILELKGPVEGLAENKEDAKVLVENSWIALIMSCDTIYKNRYVLVRSLKKNNYYNVKFNEKNELGIEELDFYYNPKEVPKVLKYCNQKNSRE